LKENRGQLKAELHELQTQIYNLQQSKGEVYEFLRLIKDQKQRVESDCKSLLSEFKQLQLQIAERQNYKEEIERDLALLKTLKPQLKEKL